MITFYFKKHLKSYIRVCSAFDNGDTVYTECVEKDNCEILFQPPTAAFTRPATIFYNVFKCYGDYTFLDLEGKTEKIIHFKL